jgi:hypothetical protein
MISSGRKIKLRARRGHDRRHVSGKRSLGIRRPTKRGLGIRACGVLLIAIKTSSSHHRLLLLLLLEKLGTGKISTSGSGALGMHHRRCGAGGARHSATIGELVKLRTRLGHGITGVRN